MRLFFYEKNALKKEVLTTDNTSCKIISSFHSPEAFTLKAISNIDNTEMFFAELSYGKDRMDSNIHIIHIDKFGRTTKDSLGLGKEVAIFIREIAEEFGFQYIQCHAKAAIYPPENKYLNQEQLELFYEKYLNGKNTSFKLVKNSSHIN